MTWRLVGGNDALAKDVIQDACVRCIEEAHQLRDLEAFESWFYRILVNSAHNRHRRFRAFKQAKALFGQEPRPQQLPTDLPDHGLQRRIRDALWTLKRSQREAFILVRLRKTFGPSICCYHEDFRASSPQSPTSRGKGSEA